MDRAESDGGAAGARVRSWAASRDEVRERVTHMRRLVGHQITAVRYVTIDYRRERAAPGCEGEWQCPTWQYPGFDAADFGVELETGRGAVFSVAWDPPGTTEGIGLREQPLLGTAVRADARVAVWDVGRRSRWAPLLGTDIVDVTPHYEPWDEQGDSFWCRRVTLGFPATAVDLLLGDAGADQRLAPSADNIAVLFDVPPASVRRQS